MENDKVIYTVITGEYDAIIEPKVITPGWDYYCFTNNPKVKSDTWKCIPLEGDEPLVLLSRRPKIRFFDYIEERHNIAIYLDANILIQCDLDVFVDSSLKNEDSMCVLEHPTWTCVYREADAIKRLGKADPAKVDRQMDRYRAEGHPQNFGQTAATLLVYRNHNFSLNKHCALWWDEFSNPDNVQRDQLSFDYLLWKHTLITISKVSYGILSDQQFHWLPHG